MCSPNRIRYPSNTIPDGDMCAIDMKENGCRSRQVEIMLKEEVYSLTTHNTPRLGIDLTLGNIQCTRNYTLKDYTVETA